MSLKLEEIMVKDVITVDAKATVKAAVDLMNRNEVGCLVVIEKRNPVGIITERDVLKRVIPRAEDPGKIRVSRIMSKPLFCGTPQMSISEALEVMFQHKVKKLPVIEHGRLVGLVTLTDLLRSPNIITWLKKLPVKKTPRGMKKVIDTYLDVERFGKKCPLLVEQGYAKRCKEADCMWWFDEECVITKLSRQISGIKSVAKLDPQSDDQPVLRMQSK